MSVATVPRFRLPTKVLLLLLAAASLALVAGASAFAVRRADRQLRAEWLQQARMVVGAINPARVAALTGTTADLASPDYQRIKTQLAAIRSANPKCRFLYFMARKSDGTVFFLVDSEPASSPDVSPPGQLYEEASAALLSAFNTGQASTEGPVTDRWGSWVSALVPLSGPKLENANVLFGMDVDASDWRKTIAQHAAFSAALSVIAVLLGILVLLLHRSQRGFHLRQQALRESQRQLQNLIDFLPDATLAIDRDKRVILWNKAIEKMTGIPAEEMIGKGDYAYTIPFYGEARPQLMDLVFGDNEKVAARYPNLVRDGDSVTAEAFCCALNRHRGAWIWVKVSPLYDGAGQIIGAIECIRDTTERKKNEEALRASEDKLGSLFESMDEMAVLHELVLDETGTPIDYRLTECNAAFVRLTGISKENAVGQLASKVYGTGTAPYLEEYARTVQSNTLSRFETYYAPMDKYFLISTVPLGGRRFATLSTDITDRRRSEEQVRKLLEDSNQARLALLGILEDHQRTETDLKRLVTAIEQSAESIVVTDAKARIQYVNPAFTAITGFAREEALGQNPRILQSGQQDAAFYRAMWATLAAGKTWQGRLVNKRKDGTLYTEDALISPVCDAGGTVVNYVAVKRDVTEELRLSAQLQQSQKMDSVGRLAGGVAHDFNNMLTIILGHAGMALDEIPPEQPLHAHLQEIQKAAKRSADLTHQLLAFARKQPIAPRVLDLNQTVGGMLNMLKRLIGEDIRLEWNPAAGLWPVRMDPSQIDQLLVNLCVNARDSIAGVGTLTIATESLALDDDACADHPEARPGDFVRLSVRDTGSGMDAETQAHIFEPFFTTKGPGEGTGLGLSTIYGIVRQNGGFIDVRSSPGHGAVFHIYLPRHVESNANNAPEAGTLLDPRGSETLLLVEDDFGILQIARQMLESLGYAVLAANGPEPALRLAAEHSGQIDLLITDVVMPGMNGRDLARQILARRPETKLLFISGYTADIIARSGVLDEGLKFIPKPFSKHALAVMIREILDG